MTKVAINGFGRIGRLVARALMQDDAHGLELVAINDLADAKSNAWLFERDSVHGRYQGSVTADGDALVIDGKRITVTAERDPANLPHGELGVDIVLECTGFFTDRESAQKHIDAGARKVLISAPAKGVDLTVVYGVNDDKLTADHTIVSNASCTTNCLAPVAKVLNDAFGIERGLMTTIHAYTNDQKILDQIHPDLRRARAAGMSMIPTTTGAARAVGEVLPELKGKLDGSAIRVPTPDVSLIDLTFTPGRAVTKDEVNAALKAAADGPMKGVLDYTDEPLVSIDLLGAPASSTVDSLETAVLDGKLVRVVSWYDNEWGFSNRMVDTRRRWPSWGERAVRADDRPAGRHRSPPRAKAPMETMERADITLADGIAGDFRGAMKGEPHRRQVTLMEADDWRQAMATLGRDLPWSDRRVNLLVDRLDLPQRAGARLRVGTALLEVTIECTPCYRMDALADGLQAALQIDWRGGVCTKVVEAGAIAVGDMIRVEA